MANGIPLNINLSSKGWSVGFGMVVSGGVRGDWFGNSVGVYGSVGIKAGGVTLGLNGGVDFNTNDGSSVTNLGASISFGDAKGKGGGTFGFGVNMRVSSKEGYQGFGLTGNIGMSGKDGMGMGANAGLSANFDKDARFISIGMCVGVTYTGAATSKDLKGMLVTAGGGVNLGYDVDSKSFSGSGYMTGGLKPGDYDSKWGPIDVGDIFNTQGATTTQAQVKGNEVGAKNEENAKDQQAVQGKEAELKDTKAAAVPVTGGGDEEYIRQANERFSHAISTNTVKDSNGQNFSTDSKQYESTEILNDNEYNKRKETLDKRQKQLDNLKSDVIRKSFDEKGWKKDIARLTVEVNDLKKYVRTQTMAGSGCMINSFVDILKSKGLDISAEKIDQILDDNLLYTPGSSMISDMNDLLKVIGNEFNVTIALNPRNYSSTQLSEMKLYLKNLVDANEPAMIRFSQNPTINEGDSAGSTHFTVISGYTIVNSDVVSFQMKDPGSSINYDIDANNFEYQKDIVKGTFSSPRVVYKVTTLIVD